VRDFLYGHGGESITLWSLLKEFCVYDFVELLDVLAHCDHAYRAGKPIARSTRDALIKVIIEASQILVDLGLVTSANLAVDFIAQIKLGQLSDDAFSQGAHSLFKTIEMETRGIICFKTDDSYIKILEGYTPIPSHVADRFPRAVQEIEDAAKCMLYERGTACVFHSMRAIEVALKAAWKTLGLPTPKFSDSWGTLLKPLDEQLEVPPKNPHPVWQANLSFFSEVVHDVRAAKRTYRDSTMHVESTYTNSEARAIFNATKTLITDAAKRLDQDGNLLPAP
jgi:hypothetical protein